MNIDLLHALTSCETDIDGALDRFSGNEAMYIGCLSLFLADPTMNQLHSAIQSAEWDAAFTAAHALKGLAGNMGFIPLYHSIGELVVLIRAGRIKDIAGVYRYVEQCYSDICRAITDALINKQA